MSKLDRNHPQDPGREPRSRSGAAPPESQESPESAAEDLLDDWLRDALDDRPEVARRLARQALATPSPARVYRRWRPLALAAGAVLLLAVIAGWPTSPPPHLPSAHDLPPRAESSPAPPAELRLSNESGFVTVTSSAGSQWIILSGAAS